MLYSALTEASNSHASDTRIQRIERSVTDRSSCNFYHTVELPDGSLTQGQWDLRQGVDQYLGDVDYLGKTVLEIGPASGFLSFHMERKGAQVTGIEPPIETFWDLVPRAGMDLELKKAQFREHIQRIRNSFWYFHTAYGSGVKLYEASAYDLPAELGQFDIGLLGSILLHCSSPVKMIESVSRRVKDTMIICDTYREHLGNGPVCSLLPSIDNNTIDTWWLFTPQFFINYLGVLGFTRSSIVRHRQLMVPSNAWQEMFTVVASRPR
jgi:SAM-dependent methyltransferase